MTVGRVIGMVLALAAASGALAEAPATSLRPVPRPAAAPGLAPVLASATPVAAITATAPGRSPRPAPRPGSDVEAAAIAAAVAASVAASLPAPEARPRDPISAFLDSLAHPGAAMAAPAAGGVLPAGVSTLAVARSLTPPPRPAGLATRVAALSPPRETSARGSVCGVNEIKGERIANINGPGACGVTDAVRVSAVAGVPLSIKPTIDCTTARALNTWVRDGVIPAVGRTGGGVARLNVVAHYSCRSRNNQPGAKLSEHGLGHAVDVAGITLADGTRLTVLEHWKSGRFGKIIQAMHRTACGPFGTVLGPKSDRYHQDHIHVDTARYRGGPYCR